MVDFGEPFTRPQLEVFLAGILLAQDGEATIPADVVRSAQGAADGIRMKQLCHVDGTITIELLKPWPMVCRRKVVDHMHPKTWLTDSQGNCWRCGWAIEDHERQLATS